MKALIYLVTFGSILWSCSSPKPESPTSNLKSSNSSDPNEYYENGNIRIEKIIDGNKEHWIFRQEDGGCWEEKFFENGEEYKRIVYNSNCVKSAEYELKNGNRHGEWISYNENGTIREKGKYEDGIPEGTFEYYDEKGTLERVENNFRVDSAWTSFWGFENHLNNFIEYLNNQKIAYKQEENIEVAGNKKYHFPILHVGLSSLYFDLEGKCTSGELNDCTFIILDKICPNDADVGLLVISGAKVENGMTHVNVYNLKEETLYQFFLENDQLKSVRFEGINRRN